MFVRGSNSSCAWKKATWAAQASVRREQRQPSSSSSHSPAPSSSQRRFLSTAENGAKNGGRTGPTALRSASSAEAKHKRELDREFLISVLESSATKRDARAYLQTFGSSLAPAPKVAPAPAVLVDGIRSMSETPRFVQGPQPEAVVHLGETPHLAIVKLRKPQAWNDALLNGVAKTLYQLRELGLLSVIVLDCGMAQAGTPGWHKTVTEQRDRLLGAIGRHGSPAAEVVESGVWKAKDVSQTSSPVTSSGLFVGFGEGLTTPLRHGHILVVMPRAYCEEALEYTPVNADEVVFALTRFFSGLQFDGHSKDTAELTGEHKSRPSRQALIDRVIVIDPLGGIPSLRYGHGAQVFINLEEEFNNIEQALDTWDSEYALDTGFSLLSRDAKTKHVENLRLVKTALAILPSTASAVITSPAEAANLKLPRKDIQQHSSVDLFAGEVRTRSWQNPLIHNLLTDRPIYSSSLPIGRIKPNKDENEILMRRMPTTTLAKKGLPVTIFPGPKPIRWHPPMPGHPRLRLTDTCIDLPRLIHLINDSFGRKLDVEHYLDRVKDSLAGIIIAGEYEGGAILTYERPMGMSEETAHKTGRLVPYLDKFAVLKKSQGAGGVADIVFNAMVQDCFPSGVCWRSRKDNPVNKWYFERSCGVRKLEDSNWAMFWTGPYASLSEQRMRDYESVCRWVPPSWADGKMVVD
ncbi:hypothetical protein B0T17DRAFT_589547 [Bombardia bombarda]|uniref:Amino-acid acetyltransferase, mitochondrial n=1 Tax=Bombardia bombarda TaxID=252184 RepID=A0AA40CA63_9PEZI|nr:hypothetical protein B0T17DRAFT_589547 [Bombardia bombarda]